MNFPLVFQLVGCVSPLYSIMCQSFHFYVGFVSCVVRSLFFGTYFLRKLQKTSGVKYRRKQVSIKYRYFGKNIDSSDTSIDTQRSFQKSITNIHIHELVTYFDFRTSNFLGFFNICPVSSLFPFQIFFKKWNFWSLFH